MIGFLLRRKARIGLGALAALAVLVATASAYFASTGTGSASASTGALGASRITSTSAGAGTVVLSWSAVTPPAGSGGVTYYVSRDGGTPAGNCPTSANPAGVTSCTDSGLSKGSYSYTVTAVWKSWTATSAATPVNVSFGAVSQLVFTTQPDGSPTGGVAFPQQPVVTAEDAGGNTVTSYSGTVALSIKSGTGTAGATLSGCSGTLTNGVTSFSGCQIDKAGSSYQLNATDGTLTDPSNAFAVAVGPATQMLFTTQPDGSPTGGVAFPTQPKLTVEDAGGNTVTSYAGTVSLSIKSGTGASGATLSGCAGTLTNGVTSFSGCQIDKAGTGYQLSASDGTLATTSNGFNVSVGPASQLLFTQQPDGSPTGGVAFPQQPKVTVEDAGGNVVTGDSSTVNLSITSGTPTSGGPGTLSGCTGTETGGVTSFTGCSINTAGTAYKLHATDGALTAINSLAFNVAVGPATQLVFTTQPDGSPTGGVAFPQQPKVTAEDAGGNTVTSYSGTVGLSIKSGTGTTGATLSGCSGTLASGVTSFSGCKIDKSGSGYQLGASDGTLTTTSNPFAVAVGPASQLVFTTQPDGAATAGSAFPTQPVVTVEDAGGNTVTSYTTAITLSIKSGTGTTGAALSGCSPALVNGVDTFSGCSINQSGTGYQLNAASGTLPISTSNGFDVTASVSATMIGQGALKSSTIANVTSTSGATDLVVIYCYGGSSCGSSGSTASVATGSGTPFSSASTNTIQSVVFSGNTKSCVEVIPAVGNGQKGTVTVSFSGGNTDAIGFVDVVQLSSGASVKATSTNPSTQTSSTAATATLSSPANSEIAVVGLDGTSADTITPPSGMTAIAPFSGSTNPESGTGIGANGDGSLGVFFAQTAQANSIFTLSPVPVDWGTIAIQVG